MYGAFVTWLILQMLVLPQVGAGGCMSRLCKTDKHAAKLETKNSSADIPRPATTGFRND